MQEHPNAAMVRRALESFNRGDIQEFADMVADDVVWHQIGDPEVIHGKQALTASMPGEGQVDWEITADVHDVVANDEHTVALVNATGRRGGRTLEYRTAEILHIRDGKITERWAFSNDTKAIAEFFA
jgi:ketosteroid isomerase-like protein